MGKKETNTQEKTGFFHTIFRLRGVLLSVPVAIIAAVMAIYSAKILPAEVGVFMQTDGQYQFMLTRPLAILIPLALTLVCVTITLCCRKVTYPWLISLFSLVVPPLLWFTSLLAS